MSKALVLAVAALAFSVVSASAQYVTPGYGYGYGYGAGPLYDYATPAADLAAPGFGYAAPGYGYAGYGAPATAGTTVIIVTPGAPAYTAPPVVGSGLYNYAPGYGRWRAGYWGGYGYGW